jgi:hypothetical protein
MTTSSRSKLLLAAAVVTMLNFSSCKKYEDGPAFSLKTKTARLTGEWEVVSVVNAGVVLNDTDLFLEFDKDGDFTYKMEYEYYGSTYSYSVDGDWEWGDGKETLEVTIDNEKTEWEIKRLTNSEFWFEDEDGSEWELDKL